MTFKKNKKTAKTPTLASYAIKILKEEEEEETAA